MSSREKILKEIAQNKPNAIPIPELPDFTTNIDNPLERFFEVLHSIGGKGKLVEDWHEVHSYLQQKMLEEVEVVNCISSLAPYHGADYVTKAAAELERVHTVFMEGKIAVAENASVWVPEKNMVNRTLPFICEHLVMVIKEAEVVITMHDAYKKVSVDEDGYGVFIAGPSKTADIEQSLVIGAHGPLSLQVFILPTQSKISS